MSVRFILLSDILEAFPKLFVVVGCDMYFRKPFNMLSKRVLATLPKKRVFSGYVHMGGFNDYSNYTVEFRINIDNALDHSRGLFTIHPEIKAPNHIMASLYEMGFEIRYVDENEGVVFYDKAAIMREQTIKNIIDEI